MHSKYDGNYGFYMMAALASNELELFLYITATLAFNEPELFHLKSFLTELCISFLTGMSIFSTLSEGPILVLFARKEGFTFS